MHAATVRRNMAAVTLPVTTITTSGPAHVAVSVDYGAEDNEEDEDGWADATATDDNRDDVHDSLFLMDACQKDGIIVLVLYMHLRFGMPLAFGCTVDKWTILKRILRWGERQTTHLTIMRAVCEIIRIELCIDTMFDWSRA